MTDWYNDPPEHPEPPEWYALIEEAIAFDPPPAISTAIRKLIGDWTEEQNRMHAEPDPPDPPDVPDIYDHQALACGTCGSASWALLRSGKIECAGCQEVRGNKWWICVAEDAVLPAAAAPTGIEANVCKDIAERQRLGIAKYGTTVERSKDDMLRHAYEEALDLSVYLRAELDRRKAKEVAP